jgi:hypothetical protein
MPSVLLSVMTNPEPRTKQFVSVKMEQLKPLLADFAYVIGDQKRMISSLCACARARRCVRGSTISSASYLPAYVFRMVLAIA